MASFEQWQWRKKRTDKFKKCFGGCGYGLEVERGQREGSARVVGW